MAKKFFSIFAIIFVTAAASAFAAVSFTDRGEFPDWAEDSIDRMADLGVVSGYADGRFDPNDAITRAEMVAILDRYDEKRNAQLNSTIFEVTSLSSVGLEPDVRAALALAKSDWSMMDEAPYLGECVEAILPLEILDLWTVYQCDALGRFYYVNFTYNGPVPEGDATADVDEWYGPYSDSTGNLRSFFL